MSAIFPVSEPAAGATHASFAVVGVPVAASSPLPEVGTVAREPPARLYV